MGIGRDQVIAVLWPKPPVGGFVHRQLLSTLISVAVVTFLVWLAMSAQTPVLGKEDARSPILLCAESLIVGLFGILICPSTTIVSNGIKCRSDLRRLGITGGTLGTVWLLVWHQPISLSAPATWYYLALLLAPAVFYVLTWRVLTSLSSVALGRRTLIIGDEHLISTIRCARPIRLQSGTKTKTLSYPARQEGLSDEVARLIKDERVSEIVVAFCDRRGSGITTSTLLDFKLRGVKVWDYTRFIEKENGRLDLGSLHPGWIVYSEGFLKRATYKVTKRITDVVLTALGLVLCLPLLGATALAIKLNDFGPVIYRQTRVGFGGELFTLYKFRSMVVNAEKISEPVWAAKNDPRVTLIGRFIRMTRIDELPQLVNVLKGEMSLVGPRPERPDFVSRLAQQNEYYRLRNYAVPGITGWAQVNLGYTDDSGGALEKLSYDLYYMKHASIWLDLYICARTVGTILWGEGAR